MPAGPINDFAQVFTDPQVVARGLEIAPEGVPGIRSPMTFSDAELALERASPRHDEHGPTIRAAVLSGVSPLGGAD